MKTLKQILITQDLALRSTSSMVQRSAIKAPKRECLRVANTTTCGWASSALIKKRTWTAANKAISRWEALATHSSSGRRAGNPREVIRASSSTGIPSTLSCPETTTRDVSAPSGATAQKTARRSERSETRNGDSTDTTYKAIILIKALTIVQMAASTASFRSPAHASLKQRVRVLI